MSFKFWPVFETEGRFKNRSRSRFIRAFMDHYLQRACFACLALKDFSCSEEEREWLTHEIKKESNKQWDAFYAESDSMRGPDVFTTVSPLREIPYRDYAYISRIARMAFLTELYFRELYKEENGRCQPG